MGLSRTGGQVMSTRSGDLDPGVLVYLLEARRLDSAALSRLLNKHSGLLGADMRDLLVREAEDPRAAEAVELSCCQARKFLGALVAVLGGLNTPDLYGRVGERAATIRARICDRLEYPGPHRMERASPSTPPIISSDGSRLVVRAVQIDEDLIITRHTHRLIEGGAAHDHDV
jgi:acetate kinase